MGNTVGVAAQALKSTKFMIKAVASSLESKKKIAKEKEKKPDPKAIITQKLIDYGSRNCRRKETMDDDGDMVEELSKKTGLATSKFFYTQNACLAVCAFVLGKTIVLLYTVYDGIGDEFCRTFDDMFHRAFPRLPHVPLTSILCAMNATMTSMPQ